MFKWDYNNKYNKFLIVFYYILELLKKYKTKKQKKYNKNYKT